MRISRNLNCIAGAFVLFFIWATPSFSQEPPNSEPESLGIKEIVAKVVAAKGYDYDELFASTDAFVDACHFQKATILADESLHQSTMLKNESERLVMQGIKRKVDVEIASITKASLANDKHFLKANEEQFRSNLRKMLCFRDSITLLCPVEPVDIPWTIAELTSIANEKNPNIVAIQAKISNLQTRITCLKRELQECEKSLLNRHRCKEIRGELCSISNQLGQCLELLATTQKDLEARITEEYQSYHSLKTAAETLLEVYPTITEKHATAALEKYAEGTNEIENVVIVFTRHFESGMKLRRSEAERDKRAYRLLVLVGVAK